MFSAIYHIPYHPQYKSSTHFNSPGEAVFENILILFLTIKFWIDMVISVMGCQNNNDNYQKCILFLVPFTVSAISHDNFWLGIKSRTFSNENEQRSWKNKQKIL